MKRALGCALILLAASAASTVRAQARLSLAGSRSEDMHFFLGGAGSASTRGVQGYLGVDVRDVAADQLFALKLKESRGAEIIHVDHDAPAGKAGLREHDVLLRMNGQILEGEEQTRRILRESPPGTTLVLLLSRDGQQMTVTTQTANREEVEREAWERHLTVPEPQGLSSDNTQGDFAVGPTSSAPAARGGNSFLGTLLMSPSYTGAMLEKMSSQLADFFGVPNGNGLLVRSVEANSPAAFAGMHAGDVVVRANARPVASSADWARAIKDSHGHPFSIVVLRDKKEQTLVLTPDGKKRSSMEQPVPTADPIDVVHLELLWMPRR